MANRHVAKRGGANSGPVPAVARETGEAETVAVRVPPRFPSSSAATPPDPPPGLLLGQVPESILRPALIETEAMLDRCTRFGNPTASETIELGVNFKAAFVFDGSQRFQVGRSIDEAPKTLALMSSAMASVRKSQDALDKTSGPESLADPMLNVIIRRFTPGQRLGFHKDAIGLFTADIWGCVLLADKAHVGALQFRLPPAPSWGGGACGSAAPAEATSVQGATARQPAEYRVPERGGLAMCQTGPSRYTWLHGVDATPWWPDVPSAGGRGYARRVSITWRWFRPEALRWSKLNATGHQLWVASFCALLIRVISQASCGWSVADDAAFADMLADFLVLWSEPLGCSGNGGWGAAARRIFAGKNDACGPQLHSLAQVKRAIDQARADLLRGPAVPEVQGQAAGEGLSEATLELSPTPRYIELGLPDLEAAACRCVADATGWWLELRGAASDDELSNLLRTFQSVYAEDLAASLPEARVRALLALLHLWAAVGEVVIEAAPTSGDLKRKKDVEAEDLDGEKAKETGPASAQGPPSREGPKRMRTIEAVDVGEKQEKENLPADTSADVPAMQTR